jgi:hypothetical protein
VSTAGTQGSKERSNELFSSRPSKSLKSEDYHKTVSHVKVVTGLLYFTLKWELTIRNMTLPPESDLDLPLYRHFLPDCKLPLDAKHFSTWAKTRTNPHLRLLNRRLSLIQHGWLINCAAVPSVPITTPSASLFWGWRGVNFILDSRAPINYKTRVICQNVEDIMDWQASFCFAKAIVIETKSNRFFWFGFWQPLPTTRTFLLSKSYYELRALFRRSQSATQLRSKCMQPRVHSYFHFVCKRFSF